MIEITTKIISKPKIQERVSYTFSLCFRSIFFNAATIFQVNIEWSIAVCAKWVSGSFYERLPKKVEFLEKFYIPVLGTPLITFALKLRNCLINALVFVALFPELKH